MKEYEFDQFKELCRQNNVKVTPQRLEIFKEVMEASDHPTADQLFQRIQDRLPSVSKDTVYRTLASFEEWGIIHRVQFLDDNIRYDPNISQHHHFVCDRCHKLIDFDWMDFNERSLPDSVKNFGVVHSSHLEIRGVCNECLEKEKTKEKKGKKLVKKN